MVVLFGLACCRRQHGGFVWLGLLHEAAWWFCLDVLLQEVTALFGMSMLQRATYLDLLLGVVAGGNRRAGNRICCMSLSQYVAEMCNSVIVHWCCCWRQLLVLHELAAGATTLVGHRFVAVDKTVDLHMSLLSIVDKRVSSSGLLAY